MARLLMHYTIPSEGLPELAKVGISYVAMFAWRCGNCNTDFHLDKKPLCCPFCAARFTKEEPFGKEVA